MRSAESPSWDDNLDVYDGTANIDPDLGVTAWVGDYTVDTQDMTFGDRQGAVQVGAVCHTAELHGG